MFHLSEEFHHRNRECPLKIKLPFVSNKIDLVKISKKYPVQKKKKKVFKNKTWQEETGEQCARIYQKRQHQGKHGVAGVGRDARGKFDDGAEHALQLAVSSEHTGDASAAVAGVCAVGRCGSIVLLIRSTVGHRSVSAAAGAAGSVGASGTSRVLRFRFEVVRGQWAAAVG